MKRQHFDISLNGAVVATTFAWNAAIRAIERMVRERARLVAVEGEKDAVYKRSSDLAICARNAAVQHRTARFYPHMLTKVLTLVLVVLIGLALGIETARYVHAHATGVDASGVVNIHHALGFSLLATSGALLLSLSREWLSRQWTRFTVWFELTLDGLFDFDNRSREICRRRSENGACAQNALDDAAKTTCTGCGVRGHRWPDCPGARTPPQREGRQHSEALFFQGGHGRTRARRHTETSCSMLSRDPDINGGDLCITGTRIPIWILWDARSGSNFQEYIDNLRMDYPNLSSEQIKAALQYAFSHPSEIDKDRFRHEVEECEGSETERQLAHPRVQNKA